MTRLEVGQNLFCLLPNLKARSATPSDKQDKVALRTTEVRKNITYDLGPLNKTCLALKPMKG